MIRRREFLASATVAVAASPFLSKTSCAEDGAHKPKRLPMIDTHQHLWDMDEIKPAWLENASPILSEVHDSETYREHALDLQIEKSIYMEVGLKPEKHVKETLRVIEICESKEFSTVAAVIGGHPGRRGFRRYIDRFKESLFVKGVRQTLFGDAGAGWCLSKEFVRDVRYLGELGLSFDICMNVEELEDGIELVRQCPKTQFILDHCGNADPHAFGTLAKLKSAQESHDPQQWKRNIEAFADFDNVVCKISGIVARAPEGKWTADDLAPIVEHCLNTFQCDRVVFGSDWPVCRRRAELGDWVEALLEIIATRPIAKRKLLLSKNAQRIYRLS